MDNKVYINVSEACQMFGLSAATVRRILKADDARECWIRIGSEKSSKILVNHEKLLNYLENHKTI